MKSVIYDNPAYWNLLWVVLILAIVVAVGITWRRRALTRFVGNIFAGLLAPGVSLTRLRIKGWLWVLAMVALVLALVDIRWGKHMVEVQQKGVDIMFVLDVSRSMLAEDVTPNRLMRAEEYIGDMLDDMKGDRAGLVVFAGSEKLLVPLTGNYSEIKMALQEAGPQSVVRGGTALGDAIRVSARSFLDKTPDYKAIVVFSDGEDMD
ncbi:MAG TPA: VWA domain-containing protein, partial [Phycisphaerae bacterium]|nr:VWA domain-containing protein [Phycisphaerae bacterium]